MSGRRAPFLGSTAGRELEKKLYEETMAEMQKYVSVPQGLVAKD